MKREEKTIVERWQMQLGMPKKGRFSYETKNAQQLAITIIMGLVCGGFAMSDRDTTEVLAICGFIFAAYIFFTIKFFHLFGR